MALGPDPAESSDWEPKKKKLIKGNWSTRRPLGISLHYLTPPFKHLRQLTSTVIILSSHSSPTSKHLFSSSKTPCSSPEYSKSRLTLKSLIFYFWFRNTSVGGMGVVMLGRWGQRHEREKDQCEDLPFLFLSADEHCFIVSTYLPTSVLLRMEATVTLQTVHLITFHPYVMHEQLFFLSMRRTWITRIKKISVYLDKQLILHNKTW